jgi:thiol:disulfide interchange protein DsbA
MSKGVCVKYFLVLLLVLFSGFSQAERFREGDDYIRLESRVDTGLSKDKVQVLEFFWYGCVHCYYLDKHLNQWMEKQPNHVSFRRIPSVMQKGWLVHAQAFYAGQRLGVHEKIHTPLFEALHDRQLPLNEMGALADFIAVKADLDPVSIEGQMANMQTRAAVLEGVQLQKQYEVSGVPTLIINGKYVLNGRLAKGFSRMIRILDYLVTKELALAH